MMFDTTYKQQISAADAKANKDYWSMTENALKQWAATVLLRQFRWYEYKTPYVSPTKPFWEHQNDTTAIAYAKLINMGQWLNLDFKNSEFIRELFKATRLKMIKKEQTVTALYLHSACENFELTSIKQFSFHDPKGPFHISQIELAEQEDIKKFYGKLKELSPSEQYYFVFNLSPIQETLFFVFGLMNERKITFTDKKYYELFIRYLDRFLKKNPTQTIILQARALLRDFNPNYVTLYKDYIPKISDALLDAELDFKLLSKFQFSEQTRLIDPLFNLPDILILLLNAGADFPFVTISPDCIDDDVNTPLISVVLPTISVYETMKMVLTGEENLNHFFTVGTITPRNIKNLAEQKPPCRPVEIFHPDVIWKGSVHQRNGGNKFASIVHDLTHDWITSMNPFMTQILYVSKVLFEMTGFDMSKSIWNIIDKSLRVYKSYRMALKKHDDKALNSLKIEFMYGLFTMIDQPSPLLSRDPQLTENWSTLIIIADMIVNHQFWENHLGISYKNLFSNLFPEPLKRHLKHMEEIIQENKKNRSVPELFKYFTLKCQFPVNSIGAKLSDLLADIHDFNKLVVWRKDNNNQIFLSPDFNEMNFNAQPIKLNVFYSTFYMFAKEHISDLEKKLSDNNSIFLSTTKSYNS